MKIAYTMSPGKGDTDLLLHGFAKRLMEHGLRPCGVVQVNTDRMDGGRCDMDVQVLPAGATLRISQSLGVGARGCRLDPGVLERAVVEVGKSLDQGADVLIINKFGKHEAEGRGFRDVIGRALMMDIPVLVGVNTLNKPAFDVFAGELAESVAPSVAALQKWLDAALAQTPELCPA